MTDIEPFYRELGRRIQQLREKRELSQEELARRLNRPLTRASIANIENGKQRVLVHTLVELVRELRTSFEELIPETEEDRPEAWDRKEIEKELEKELSQLPQTQIKKLVSRLHHKKKEGNT